MISEMFWKLETSWSNGVDQSLMWLFAHWVQEIRQKNLEELISYVFEKVEGNEEKLYYWLYYSITIISIACKLFEIIIKTHFMEYLESTFQALLSKSFCTLFYLWLPFFSTPWLFWLAFHWTPTVHPVSWAGRVVRQSAPDSQALGILCYLVGTM